MADEFCLKTPDFHDLLYAVNLRYGTNGFTPLPKEGVLRILFALKNPTVSAWFEPANLGTKGQHATSRPPKPIVGRCYRNTLYQLHRRYSDEESGKITKNEQTCLWVTHRHLNTVQRHSMKVRFPLCTWQRRTSEGRCHTTRSYPLN